MADITWTRSLVEERFAEAADTLHRLPDVRVQGHASTWAPYIQKCRSAEEVTLRRPPPSAAAISRMDEALPWLRHLDPVDAKIVWLRADGDPWKVILYPTLRRIDVFLARWAHGKFKSLNRHKRQTHHWLERIARRHTGLFAHWSLLYGRGRTMGAG